MAEIEGIRTTIAELRKVEPAMARQAIKDIKAPANAAAAAVRGVAPAVPLTRMGYHGPVKVGVSYGGRKRADGSAPLVRIKITGPSWVIASDMARNATPGESLVPNLTRKYGQASRWAYPTVEPMVPGIEVGVRLAAKQVEREATRRLA